LAYAKDDEITQLFISMEATLCPEVALFLANVTEFKAAAAPLVLLDPVSAALLNAAKEGNIGVICVCLNNDADIESKDEVCILFSYFFNLHLTILLGVWSDSSYLGLCEWSC
jgi:hypothetical protein